MQFQDEKYLQILHSTTKERENFRLELFDLVLDDDRNYHNDEFLLFMGDHSKVKKIVSRDGKSEFALKIVN